MFNRQQRGYGDFGGMGSYTDFGNVDNGAGGMDEDTEVKTTTARATGGGGRMPSLVSSIGMGGGGGGEIRQEIFYLKQDNQIIKNAVMELEKDRDNLRQAIRKLKIENSRMKLKMKRVHEKLGGGRDAMDVGDVDSDIDFDEVKDYILVGGPMDPLSLRYEATIRDGAGLEHKTAERYYWYKMAEHFGQTSTAEEIRTAANTIKAEEVMKTIKDFDEASWAAVKLKYWEEGTRMKIDQVRWIQNLLIYTDKSYLAVASQDKVFGTGWRKNRLEAWSPKYWDGENGGGKVLMKLRDHFKQNHAWMGPYEEQETEKKFKELKGTAWRRDRRDQFGNRMRGGGFGGKRGSAGGRGGGGYPQKRIRQF